MEITLLHHPCSFTPDGDYPTTPLPAHLPLMEITLLHHPCQFTPDGDYPIIPSLLIYPKCRLPYFTTPCSFTPDGDYPTHQTGLLLITPDGDYPTTPDRPPANQPQMEISLLQQYALESSSSFTTLKDQQSGLDMERWLTPLENFYLWKTFYPRG